MTIRLMSYASAFLFTLAIAVDLPAAESGFDPRNSCLTGKCSVGSRVITFTPEGSHAWLCDTLEVEEYINIFAIELDDHFQRTGVRPAVASDGNPIYPGTNSKGIEYLRARANVKDLKEARSHCRLASSGETFVVTAVAPASSYVKVRKDGKQASGLWLPNFYCSLAKAE